MLERSRYRDDARIENRHFSCEAKGVDRVEGGSRQDWNVDRYEEAVVQILGVRGHAAPRDAKYVVSFTAVFTIVHETAISSCSQMRAEY